MTELLVFRDKVKGLYGRYSMVFDYVAKFVLAFAGLMLVRGMTGYDRVFSRVPIILLLSFVCMLLPKCITVFSIAITSLIQMYEVAPEYALIALMVYVLIFVLYFLFSPDRGYVVVLTLLLMQIGIPYAIPIIVGLTASAAGIIPMILGLFMFYAMGFAGDFMAASKNFAEGDFVQKINLIIDNTVLNKQMLVIAIVFAAVVLLVAVLKTFSLAYSWLIAIGTGAVVNIILVIMSHTMLSLSYNVFVLFLGTLVGVGMGALIYFFVLSLDYSSTEQLVFEDDDYMYYVKAVPKMSVPKTEVTMKKINRRREVEEEMPVSPVEDDPGFVEDEDESEKRRAYEQDLVDLEDEE